MKHSSFLLLTIPFLFIGCSKKTINMDEKPKLQMPKVYKPIKKKKGSLYTRRGPSLFSDKKDLQVGDIIEVIIDESLTNSSKNSFDTTKATSANTSGSIVNNATTVGYSYAAKNSFKGSVSAKADEAFTTTISAVITQVYQNGNYFIKGSKAMLINGQKQIIKISGLIRPYDITPGNTINSSQLANLKVLYDKEGKGTDSLDKAWGTKLIDFISPF